MKKKISQILPLFVIVFGAIFFVTFIGFVAISESGNTGSNLYNTDLPYVDIDGETIRLTDHNEKVIILYFFYLSCPYCKISDPFLAAIEDDYFSSQLLIITITIATADSDINLNNWRNNLNASWNIVRDDISLTYASNWDVAYTPTAVIIHLDSNFLEIIEGSLNFDAKVRSELQLLI